MMCCLYCGAEMQEGDYRLCSACLEEEIGCSLQMQEEAATITQALDIVRAARAALKGGDDED